METLKNQARAFNGEVMSKHISSIGRPLDPRYPSNVAVVAFSGAMFVLFTLVSLINDVSLRDSIEEGFFVAVFAFLAWAVGREVDPDYNLTAYVAMVLAVGAYLVWGGSNLLGVAMLMWAQRIVNRITGLTPTLLDYVMLTLGAGLLSYMGHPLIGIMTVGAFILNTLLDDPDKPNGWIFGGLALVATGIGTLLADPIVRDFTLEPVWGVVAGVTLIAYLLVALNTQHTFTSFTDYKHKLISRQRIMWTRLLMLMLAVAWLLWAGESAGTALATLFVVMIGNIVTVGVNRL